MDDIQPFTAATEQYTLTETEAHELRSHLFALRKQYVLRIWEPQLELMLPSMDKLEAQIAELEHKLAHAVITE